MNGTDPTGLAGCVDAGSQGLAGKCIDASSYNAKKDSTQTVIASTAIDSKAAQVAPSLESTKTERGTTIERDASGTLSSQIPTVGGNNNTGQQTSITPTSNTVAVVHSHPNNSSYGIQPGFAGKGKGDHRSVEGGKPNYITRNGTVIVVERSGGQYRARVVSGQLASGDAAEIRGALNEFQKDSRGRKQ